MIKRVHFKNSLKSLQTKPLLTAENTAGMNHLHILLGFLLQIIYVLCCFPYTKGTLSKLKRVRGCVHTEHSNFFLCRTKSISARVTQNLSTSFFVGQQGTKLMPDFTLGVQNSSPSLPAFLAVHNSSNPHRRCCPAGERHMTC